MAAGAALCILAIVILAAFAPLLAPHDPELAPPDASPYAPPIWSSGADPRFLLGTDGSARDELSRLLYASRVSLLVGLVPTALIVCLGVPIGLLSGWLGGRWDDLLMRIAEAVYAFPSLLFFILVRFAFGETALGRAWDGVLLLSLALAAVGWVNLARLVRGRVLSLRREEYVVAAVSVGAPTMRVLVRHVIPNTLSTIIVAATLEIPAAILAEALLGAVNLGVRDPSYSLGTLLFESFGAIVYAPASVLLPTGLITLLAVAFALLGGALRDALDPTTG